MSPIGERPEVPGLAEAIVLGLRSLSDLTRPPPEVSSGALERILRLAAARHETSCDRFAQDARSAEPLEQAAVGVRAACAHLSARDLPDAYLALRAALDVLPAHTPAPEEHRVDVVTSTTEVRRAEASAATHRRLLGDRRDTGRASGILAQRGRLSVDVATTLLRGYAAHRGIELPDLVRDVVAGRVDPATVIASQDAVESDAAGGPRRRDAADSR